MKKKNIQKEFTLVELLVVIAIISIMAAILLPAIKKAVALTNLTKCKSNLRQIGLAMHMRANDHRGKFYVSTTADRSSDIAQGIVWPFAAHFTHSMVKEYMFSWNDSDRPWRNYNPSPDELKYITSFDVFACPNALSSSLWDKNTDFGPTIKEMFFRYYGTGFYYTTMFDTARGGDRGRDRRDWNADRSQWWIKGCHQWAPSPDHPSHTWTYFCPGHEDVEGVNYLRVWNRDLTGANEVSWMGWYYSGGTAPSKILRTGNILYVDGHVKYHNLMRYPLRLWFPGGGEHIDDACKLIRGMSCKR